MIEWDEAAVEDASESGEDASRQSECSLTPKTHRRRRNAGADADDEREGEIPKRRGLSNLSSAQRHTPARKAKKRAMKAIKAVEDGDSDDVEMEEDIDQDVVDSEESEDGLCRCSLRFPNTG